MSPVSPLTHTCYVQPVCVCKPAHAVYLHTPPHNPRPWRSRGHSGVAAGRQAGRQHRRRRRRRLLWRYRPCWYTWQRRLSASPAKNGCVPTCARCAATNWRRWRGSGRKPPDWPPPPRSVAELPPPPPPGPSPRPPPSPDSSAVRSCAVSIAACAYTTPGEAMSARRERCCLAAAAAEWCRCRSVSSLHPARTCRARSCSALF